VKSAAAIAGPSERAGFIDAPVTGPPNIASRPTVAATAIAAATPTARESVAPRAPARAPAASAAARPGRGLDDREALRRGCGSLDRLDDRAVHPVGDLVRELDRDLLEARGLEPRLVLGLREGAGDTADVAAALGPLAGGEPVLGDDVAHPEPSARPQHAADLGEHRGLVGGQV